MATLELVPLRSSLPTGRMTLRHPIPAFNPSFDEIALVEDLISTTPQVADENEAGETAARKGGEAR